MRGAMTTGTSSLVASTDALRAVRVRLALRTLGVAAVTGVGTGVVVAGVGGRLVMKIIALTAAPATGRVTANGNTVGDFTVEGTLSILLFSGLLFGLVGGLLYLSFRPWLTSLGPWRGLAYGIVVLALMGHTVFESTNFDFRVFGSTGVNLALFALLFIGFGLVIAPAFERLAAAAERSRTAAAVAWLGMLPALLFVALAMSAAIAALFGQGTDARPEFALLTFGTFLAGALGRIIGVGRPAALAVIALPVLAGGVITATALAHILTG